VELPQNCRVLMYSDGLTDALPTADANCPAFGVDGITDTLRKCVADPLEQALDMLFRNSSAFTGGAGRHDDTSVVLVERMLMTVEELAAAHAEAKRLDKGDARS